MKNLIMLNMSHRFDWDAGVANRNYHVLKTIQATGEFDTIVSVDFLPFTFKKRVKVWLKGKLYKKNADSVFYNGSVRVDADSNDPKLFWMTALTLDYLPAVMRHMELDPEETVLWSYTPFASKEIKKFEGISVFDAVDNWIDHPSYTEHTETLEKHYSRIRKHANLIFTVSEGLVDFFEKKETVYYIPNGVDATHFAPTKAKPDVAVPKELAQRDAKRPLIGYHGVIQNRVNFSILKFLAEEHPEWDIAIIGPVWDEVQKDVAELAKKSNVYTTGAVSYQDLPQYIQQFDVAIIPHKVDRFTQSMNPLKMYEYLAAGKPVVSTAVAGAEQFQDYITLAVSPDDFATGVAEMLNNDTPELIERRMTAASAHSWESRVSVMLKKLQKLAEQRKKEAEETAETEQQ